MRFDCFIGIFAAEDGNHISRKGYEILTEYARGVLGHYFENP
jgi:hypothetical protein